MAQIDIAVVIDAVTLAQSKPGGTWNSPISLGSYSQSDVYVFMITQGQYVVNEQAQSELTVAANVGDIISFNMTAPGAGVNYYPILYNAVLDNNNVVNLGNMLLDWDNYLLSSGGSGAQPVFADTVPPGNDGAGNPNNCLNSTWKMEVRAVGNGQTQYNMWFSIVDTNNGNVIGYYIWDPFINITN